MSCKLSLGYVVLFESFYHSLPRFKWDIFCVCITNTSSRVVNRHTCKSVSLYVNLSHYLWELLFWETTSVRLTTFRVLSFNKTYFCHYFLFCANDYIREELIAVIFQYILWNVFTVLYRVTHKPLHGGEFWRHYYDVQPARGVHPAIMWCIVSATPHTYGIHHLENLL